MQIKKLNKAGEIYIANWIKENFKNIGMVTDFSPWFENAEFEANECGEGEAIVIELKRIETRSGNPETLEICTECLDT